MDEHTTRSTQPSHQPGTRKGEDVAQSQDESGRQHTGTTQTGRPTGTSGGRFSTGINPEAENPIDPNSPNMPPP
jgi:hypothetical protein